LNANAGITSGNMQTVDSTRFFPNATYRDDLDRLGIHGDLHQPRAPTMCDADFPVAPVGRTSQKLAVGSDHDLAGLGKCRRESPKRDPERLWIETLDQPAERVS